MPDDAPTFTGYAVMSVWRIIKTGEECASLDWESVSDTIDEALEHAKTWHDDQECCLVRVTATVERVASVVDCDEPEAAEPEGGLLFV